MYKIEVHCPPQAEFRCGWNVIKVEVDTVERLRFVAVSAFYCCISHIVVMHDGEKTVHDSLASLFHKYK